MTWADVPFQPNVNPDGTREPARRQGRRDPLRRRRSPDPGGLPLGTLEYLTFDRFYNVAGQPFQATLHLKSGSAARSRPARPR